MDGTFEDFLRGWHAKGYTGTDDAMPDEFDDWLAELEQEQLIALADAAIREAFIRGVKHGGEVAVAAISDKQSEV